MKLPLILINFKCYREATGKNAIKLAKVCEEISKNFKISIAIAPQFTDIKSISEKVKIPMFAQHFDVEEGAFTGSISILAVKDAGVVGSLINHSEKKLSTEETGKRIEIAKKYGLITVCCAATSEEAEQIANFNPDFIAIEPPELISSGIAVSKAKPELITQTLEKVKRTNPKVKVLCGAGITSEEDVKKALELGTKGVLVASGIVKSKNPRKALIEFAKAIR